MNEFILFLLIEISDYLVSQSFQFGILEQGELNTAKFPDLTDNIIVFPSCLHR